MVHMLLQLGRIARSITAFPSFTKKLAVVLSAVSGLVDPKSPIHLSEKMLAAIAHPASARVQRAQIGRGTMFSVPDGAGPPVSSKIKPVSIIGTKAELYEEAAGEE